jgi:Ca-activated chloride channel family protein
MISFEFLWVLLLLPLPLIVRRFLPPAARSEEAALRVPDLAPFSLPLDDRSSARSGAGFGMWLAALIWLLLLLAAARPVWVGDPIELPRAGRDLMLAVDLSGSMKTEDFELHGNQINRLDAVKEIAGEFIERRSGDRLGLILFGSAAYLQTPLSFDRKTVNAMLQESAIGLAGNATAIGDAIGLAVKQLLQHPDGNKVLILLTDGASNAGQVEPQQAAQLAAKQGLTIYTIGIGADEMTVSTFFGSQRVPTGSDLDEEGMRAIAKATGGRYFRARDSAQLGEIYAILDKLQPLDQDHQTFRPRKAYFYWPLTAALVLALLFALLLALSAALPAKSAASGSAKTQGGA